MNNYKRGLILSVLICMVVSITGCTKSSGKENADGASHALYELYAYDQSGIIQYVPIQSIHESGVDYSQPQDINLRRQGLMLDDIAETAQNKIYVSSYRKDNGDRLDNRIFVLSHGKVEKSITLKTSRGPNRLMSDVGKNKVYVLMAFQPAAYNPKGNVIDIIDTQKDQYIKTMYLKGGFKGYDIKNNLIYTSAFAFNALGFTDVPDQYIATIDRDTSKVNVLTKNGMNHPAIDLKIAPNGKIYSLNSPTQGEGADMKLKFYHGCTINIYSIDGTLLKTIPLNMSGGQLLINQQGIAYINYHFNNEQMKPYSGTKIMVFDTNKDKVTGEITGFNGCSAMYMKDNYLFVANYTTGDVTVIDMKTNKKIGNMHLKLGDRPVNIIKLLVLKKKTTP